MYSVFTVAAKCIRTTHRLHSAMSSGHSANLPGREDVSPPVRHFPFDFVSMSVVYGMNSGCFCCCGGGGGSREMNRRTAGTLPGQT